MKKILILLALSLPFLSQAQTVQIVGRVPVTDTNKLPAVSQFLNLTTFNRAMKTDTLYNKSGAMYVGTTTNHNVNIVTNGSNVITAYASGYVGMPFLPTEQKAAGDGGYIYQNDENTLLVHTPLIPVADVSGAEQTANKATNLTSPNNTKYPTTLAVSNAIAAIPVLDTSSLSNRINTKLNTSDTTAMLSPYLRKIDTTGTTKDWATGVTGKPSFITGLTTGTTTIASGTNGRVLYNNSGVLGEKTVTGTGNVVLATAPTMTGQVTINGADALTTGRALVVNNSSQSDFLLSVHNNQGVSIGNDSLDYLGTDINDAFPSVTHYKFNVDFDSNGRMWHRIGNRNTGTHAMTTLLIGNGRRAEYGSIQTLPANNVDNLGMLRGTYFIGAGSGLNLGMRLYADNGVISMDTRNLVSGGIDSMKALVVGRTLSGGGCDACIGINTTLPTSRLHVYENVNALAKITCENPNASSAASTAVIAQGNTGYTYIGNFSSTYSSAIGWATGGAGILRNTGAGELGIINQGNHGIGLWVDNNTGTWFNALGITQAGNISIPTVGKKILYKTGTNACFGTSALSSGTVTVSTTCVSANSKVFLTAQNCSSCGILSVGTVTAGTSFVINSSNGSDASTVAWWIVDSQ